MCKKLLLFSFIFLVLFNYSCKKENTEPVAEPMLNISRSTVDVGNDAGFTDTVTIRANVEWTISLSESANAWLKAEVDKDTLGAVTGVKLTVIKTNTGATQTATLTITPVGANVSPLQVSITQKSYSLTWQRCYGGSGADFCYALAQLSNGDIAGNGFSTSKDGDALGNLGYFYGWTIRTGSTGNLLWQKSIGNNSYASSFRVIAATTDGGTVSAGSTQTNGRGRDVMVTKLDTNGNSLWNKAYGGSGDEWAYGIINTADGGYLIAGNTYSTDGDIKSTHGNVDLWVFKIDVNGNLVWEKTFGGNKIDTYGALASSSDGGYFLLGNTDSGNDGDVPANHGGNDILVIKMDANGNKIWSKAFGGSQTEYGNRIYSDVDGGCLVAGSTESSDGDVIGNHSTYGSDMWVLKINKAGQLVWQATLGGRLNDVANALVHLPNGNIMVAGSTSSFDGDVTRLNGPGDVWVVELSSTGKKLWQRSFGSSALEGAADITIAADGSIVIVSNTTGNDGDISGNHGDYDAWVFKLK